MITRENENGLWTEPVTASWEIKPYTFGELWSTKWIRTIGHLE